MVSVLAYTNKMSNHQNIDFSLISSKACVWVSIFVCVCVCLQLSTEKISAVRRHHRNTFGYC